MMLHRFFERHWQRPYPLLSLLLAPWSRLFGCVAAKRRRDFLSGRKTAETLPVPVVVVGNIHTGGVGKTPVVAALVRGLQARGLRVGIISRGYGRREKGVHVLTPHSTARQAGDEPLLLQRQTGAPVAVAAVRAEAGRALLAAYPDLDVLVADDGLQHYALARDVEIIVFPYADRNRPLGLLPDGPLREPLSRLETADALVFGGCPHDVRREDGVFYSRVAAGAAYRFNRPQEIWPSGRLKTGTTAALAAIAKPERFFASLRAAGIVPDSVHSLPDHAVLTAADLPQADAVFITEKDAVKLTPSAATENVWVLPVCAIIEPDLADFVLEKLKKAV
ncbi:tetraacyldisaccharide 4'-kinase [Neisseria leonii]|uniref:Tetraacyldisaccharide 4'-kinase n=1 Tax=Neisseria leonii TaxID=2995413 RepID=A0A9X4E0V5_9NEIS|nr:tetraacyldisaccharide 4'-kinase [Neisseria sp. 51.81]MDD9327427.1 tetraacyldisaccharide 4'-kinase [Neisseria sp. 51.81]